MTTKGNPRGLALDTLIKVGAGQYANLTLDGVLRRADMIEADRHLYTVLVYGTLERLITLDFLIEQLSDRTDVEEEVRWILRLGLYQLGFLDRVPDHAAINETVDLAPRRAKGFVNALLRTYTRQMAGQERPVTPSEWVERFPVLAHDPLKACSVAYALPVALCEKMQAAFGECAEAVMAAFLEKPPMAIRCNTLKNSPDELAARLMSEGCTVTGGRYLPDALLVTAGNPLAGQAFAEGCFFVQDEASQICVHVLGAKPDERMADTCACPGSKTFGSAVRMENRGEIHAFDLHKSKLSLIESGAARLGVSVVQTEERDARTPDAALFGTMDRVLCDVPCSGLGVIAKKPEIRHKDLSACDRLPAIQAAILEASAAYVKAGGTLVYSTCTWADEENGHVVEGFLKAHPEFEPEEFTIPARRDGYEAIVSARGQVTLTPDRHGTDGFFVARMKRVK